MGACTAGGRNFYGQLGNGSNADSNVPVTVTGLSGATAIGVGTDHSCAITSSSLKCWGRNQQGQLGNNSLVDSTVPVNVSGLSSGVIAIALGEAHTCSLIASGVRCWGRNLEGQLGNDSTTDSSVPATVTGLSGVAAIEAGAFHTCAVTNGSMKCWGGNYYHQLGNNGLYDSHVPSNVAGLSSHVTAMAVGKFHTCAIDDGSLKCWGYNGTGQLGSGNTVSAVVPASVLNLTGTISFIAAGEAHTCAMLDTGVVKCWGRNAFGELGNGVIANSSAPVNVSGITSVIAVTANYLHTCALVSEGGSGGDGGVKCWGNNAYGGLGNGSVWNSSAPVAVSGLSSNVIAIAAGDWHSCAVMRGGAVKCWGRNSEGQLGVGNRTDSNVPVDVAGLSGVSAIKAGGYHTCALLGTGGVKCWGYGIYGQVGNGSTADSIAPADVIGLSSGVAEVEVGGYYSCARMTSGGVKCWGLNEYGQLGNSATANSSTPVNVSNLNSGVEELAVGDSHTCAVVSGGAVRCWGNNIFKQLGSDGIAFSAVPVTAGGLGAGVSTIATGGWHTCVRVGTLDGLKC